MKMALEGSSIMNEIVSELLDGVKTGDRVRVRFGNGSSQEVMEGTIERWSDYFLYLRKVDGGQARILLDDLRMIDSISESSVSNKPETTIVPPSIFIQPVVPSQPYGHAISRGFQQLNPAQSISYGNDFVLSEIKEKIRLLNNQSLKQSMGGILDSLASAIKNNQVSYKYHNLRAKLLRECWEQCCIDIEYQSLYYFVGALAVISADYQYALEPLVRAKDYKLAAYAASSAKDTESAQTFTICALMNGEGIEIDQYISSIFVQKLDVPTLKELLEKSKNNQIECEKYCTIAYNMFLASNGILKTDITPYMSAYSAAIELMNSIPATLVKAKPIIDYWRIFSSYNYPTNDDSSLSDEYIISTIIRFNEKTGFIRNNSSNGTQKSDYFFYIAQIRDDTNEGILLRKLLYNDLAERLEVRFKLGKSLVSVGKTAAFSVELTSSGYAEGLKRYESYTGNLGAHIGFVERFNQSTQAGTIVCNSRIFGFNINDIVDPWLRTYYRECFPIREQNVSFEIAGTNVKNVRWHNPLESERQMYSHCITDDEIEQWEEFQKSNSIQTIASESYASFPYQALESIDSADESKRDQNPLTWGGASIVCKKDAETKRASVPVSSKKEKSTTTVTPPSKPVPPNTHIITTSNELAERARRASIAGDLESAEKDFADYLKRDFSESVVCDYVTLCIRMGKNDKAIEIIKQYESQMSKDKVLNLKIQAYEKKKDYSTLLPLYEESLHRALTFTKKSHNLYRRIDALIKLSRYEDALKECKRWESIINQSRFSTDADKIKISIINIKRYRAICYYYLGNKQEAEMLAADLLRANPQDSAAVSILDGTLGATELTDEDPLFGEDDEPDEGDWNRFVRNRVNQTDIAVSLKSSKLKDGKYVGTIKEGLSDIRDLARTPRGAKRTLNARCEALFAACKLWEQLEARPDFSAVITEMRYPQYYKYRLAGRAMASWGDTMVSQLQQIDTTRMAYLYALRVLKPSKDGIEQDWNNCYNRYIRSFFVARIGSNSLDEYINQQTNIGAKDPINTNILINNRIADVLIPEFVVGMLLLIHSLFEQKDKRDMLISDLYSKNVEVRAAICKQLSDQFELAVSLEDRLDKFSSQLLKASAIIEQRVILLQQKVKDITDRIFSDVFTTEDIGNLDEGNWKSYLTATDIRYLKKYQYIVKRSRDYSQNLDFDNRADCLQAMSLEVADLLEEIEKGPTDVSYDILKPSLEQIAFILSEVQNKLFRDYQPKITLGENIQPFRTPNGHIEIRLLVRNETNYQVAEAFRITNVYGAEVTRFIGSTPARNVRGGESIEIGFEVQISEESNHLGSFSARLAYTYNHDDENQTVLTKNTEFDTTFYIRSENFVQIKNPFDSYVGKVMTDDAMFIGRESQIDQLIKMVFPYGEKSMNYGRAVAMYGQTRTGKSSLMYHFAKRLREKYNDTVFVLDMGNIAEYISSGNFTNSFIYTMLSIAEEELETCPDVFDAMSEYSIEDILSKLANNDPLAVSMFKRYMQKLDAVLQKQNRIIVLMVDEFTYLHKWIKEGVIPFNFMEFWKALLQNHCIYAVIVGQDDMPEFMREYPNEFGAMELIKLNYLDEPDAKKLIRLPLLSVNKGRDVFADDEPVNDIYELTAGSAYLTIILCSNLIKYINEKGAYVVTKGIMEDFLRTRAFGASTFLTEEYFEPQLLERGHDELKAVNRSILTQIARLSKSMGYAHVNDIHYESYELSSIQELIQRLCDRDVLVKDGRDRYKIKVKIFERWLLFQDGE